MIIRAAIASARKPLGYTFPLISTLATTFDVGDWVQEWGNLYQKDTSDHFVVSNTTDRGRAYQEFSIPSNFNTKIDEGNARIDLSHVVWDFGSDQDGGSAYATFYDVSSGYLGRVFMPHVDNVDTTSPGTYQEELGLLVPPGARTVRIGWQSWLDSGAEISWYPSDLQAEMNVVSTYDDAEMLFSEDASVSTGWSGVTGIVTVLAGSTTDDWEAAGREAKYTGGPSNALNEIKKNFTMPGGWSARIAAGTASLVVRSTVGRANNADDAEVFVTFDPSGTPSIESTGVIATNFNWLHGDLTVPVPTGATSDFDLHLKFTRGDGVYNDGFVNHISMWLVNTA